MITEPLFSRLLFPLIEATTGTRFWTRYQEILAGLSLAPEARLQSQQQKLASLLKLAGEHVEIWQEIFEQQGIAIENIDASNAEAIIARLPIAQKATFASGFPDRVTVKQDADRWQYLSSAGTTGRMTVVTDFAKRDYLRAAELLNIKLAIDSVVGAPTTDIPPSACNVVCGFADEGPEPLLEYIVWCIKQKRLFDEASISDMRGRFERQVLLKRDTYLPLDPAPWETLSVQLDEYLDKIINEKKQVVRGLPHFLLWLAKRAEQRQLQFPHVTALLPYGGLVGEALRERICAAFGASFINFYGTGEVGAIGGSSDGSDLLEIYEEIIYLEILDEQDQRVTDGEAGRVVITDLTNRAMPIIRYDIGDRGYCVTDTASGKRRLKLLGRRQEAFANGTGETISARELQNFFFAHAGIINFKVERIAADIYKASVVSVEDVDQRQLEDELHTLLDCKSRPKIKLVPFITPETSGKYIGFKDLSGIY